MTLLQFSKEPGILVSLPLMELPIQMVQLMLEVFPAVVAARSKAVLCCVWGHLHTHKYCLESVSFLYETAKSWELEGHTGSSSETHKTLQHLTVCCLSPPYWHFLLLLLKIRHPALPFRAGESEEGAGWGVAHTNLECGG